MKVWGMAFSTDHWSLIAFLLVTGCLLTGHWSHFYWLLILRLTGCFFLKVLNTHQCESETHLKHI